MARTPKQIQTAADNAFTSGLKKWLERLVASEDESRQLHDTIAQRIKRRLGSNPRPGDAQRVIRRELRRAERARLAIIRRTVEMAAEVGANIPPAVAQAVFGRTAAARAFSPTMTASRRASIVAGRRLNGSMTIDRRAVASRLRARTGQTSRRAARAIESSLRVGESTRQSAERLLRSGDVRVRIPRYIQDVRDAVAGGDPSQVTRVARRELQRLRQGNLAEHDIASDTRIFLQRIERSQGEDIDAALDTWVRGRANNQAMTIARTEGQQAHAQAYVEQIQDQDWVPGFRWNLSPAHKRPDVCDIMASQDLFGLGPGGYPASDVPGLAHPNDLCFFTAIVDPHHFERQKAQRDGTNEPARPWESGQRQTGAQWLQSQTSARRREILGPGRASEFQRRPGRVVNGDGSLNPLYRVQGRRPPPPPEGEVFVRRPNGVVNTLSGGQRARRSR